MSTPLPNQDPLPPSSGPAQTTTSSSSSSSLLPSPPEPKNNIPTNPTTTTAAPLPPTTTSSTSSPSQSPPYHSFHTYPFATDAEFKLGLGVILGKPAGTPATEDEVRGTRRNGGGGVGVGDEYAALGGELLLKAKMFYFAKPELMGIPHPVTNTLEPHNCWLPIPGIQEVPDTVLTGKDKPSVAARRRKPWEVAAAPDGVAADGGSTSVEGGGDGAGVDKDKDGGGEVEEQQQQLQ
ncbi:hypothetical protein EMPG_14426 [Blastomyces silverae]|uniref:Uncharacterized protein n=1 Tax=Blastomyces silverae TaxID=2060906 RepID=A0A0H1BFM3_9EURO|nr:hypothetical protein EMPG_14426 [Blastomyces silverae]